MCTLECKPELLAAGRELCKDVNLKECQESCNDKHRFPMTTGFRLGYHLGNLSVQKTFNGHEAFVHNTEHLRFGNRRSCF